VREREKSRDAGSERMGKVVETSGPFLKKDFGQFATLENNRSVVLPNFFLPVGTEEFLSI
jgi:hypothetical protein